MHVIVTFGKFPFAKFLFLDFFLYVPCDEEFDSLFLGMGTISQNSKLSTTIQKPPYNLFS